MFSTAVAGTDVDGTTIWGWCRYELDPMRRTTVNPTATPDAADFARDFENKRRLNGMAQLAPTAYRAEAQKFAGEWPELARKLDLFGDFPAPMFDVGVVSYPVRPQPPFDFDINWIRDQVDKHTSHSVRDHGQG